MKQKYLLGGLHCSSCVARVEKVLTNMPKVLSAVVTADGAEIEMSVEIPVEQLQAAIGNVGMYTIKKNADAATV